jgi:hypothetical protein
MVLHVTESHGGAIALTLISQMVLQARRRSREILAAGLHFARLVRLRARKAGISPF